MTLQKLVQGIYSGEIPARFQDEDIRQITSDSRLVIPSSVFIAKKGLADDGFKYVADAVKRGARVIVSDRTIANTLLTPDVWSLKVEDMDTCIRSLIQRFYSYDPDKIKVVGLTGTNGKTTITYLLESIFQQAGEDCGVIGTVNYRIKGREIQSAKNTTPGLIENQQLLHEMVRQGVSYCFMEVSSHALDQGRTQLIKFHSAAFTNLSLDHLDYHENMDNYFLTKAKLFQSLSREQTAVINLDDAYAQRLLPLCKASILSYGIQNQADVMAQGIEMDQDGTSFELVCPEGRFHIETSMIGSYNIYNMLAAVCVALAENIDLKIIKNGLTRIPFIPGRLERVALKKDFSVFIDYAHTPDALLNVLKTIKSLASERIILVFGCGGERDQTKRSVMGRIAGSLADLSVVTSDNPRREDPQSIVDQIITGFETDNYIPILDRKEAIRYALTQAQKGDIVLVAGKGHETYQIFGQKKVVFCEREIIQNILDHADPSGSVKE